jgi:hypothetical protein
VSELDPLLRVPVGVVLERRKAKTAWADFVWSVAAALPGLPEAAPWTPLLQSAEITTYYAGPAELVLHRSDTAHYRDNLASGAPALWVVLRPTGVDPPYQIVVVTADPYEGEAYAGSDADLVERVAMPEQIQSVLEAFVAQHHVEQPFYKRKREKADPEALGRPASHGKDVKR